MTVDLFKIFDSYIRGFAIDEILYIQVIKKKSSKVSSGSKSPFVIQVVDSTLVLNRTFCFLEMHLIDLA